MHWLNDLMWAACRALGWACQLAGFTGLVILILAAFRHWVLWMEGWTP